MAGNRALQAKALKLKTQRHAAPKPMPLERCGIDPVLVIFCRFYTRKHEMVQVLKTHKPRVVKNRYCATPNKLDLSSVTWASDPTTTIVSKAEVRALLKRRVR